MGNKTCTNNFQSKAFLIDICKMIPEAVDCIVINEQANDSLSKDFFDITVKVNIDGTDLFINATCFELHEGISKLHNEFIKTKDRFAELKSEYKIGEDIFYDLSNFIYSQYLLDLIFVRRDKFDTSQLLDARPFLDIASKFNNPLEALEEAFELSQGA